MWEPVECVPHRRRLCAKPLSKTGGLAANTAEQACGSPHPLRWLDLSTSRWVTWKLGFFHHWTSQMSGSDSPSTQWLCSLQMPGVGVGGLEATCSIFRVSRKDAALD